MSFSFQQQESTMTYGIPQLILPSYINRYSSKYQATHCTYLAGSQIVSIQNLQMLKYATIGEREIHYAMKNKQGLMDTKSSIAFGQLMTTTNNLKGNWTKNGCHPYRRQPLLF